MTEVQEQHKERNWFYLELGLRAVRKLSPKTFESHGSKVKWGKLKKRKRKKEKKKKTEILSKSLEVESTMQFQDTMVQIG